MRIAFAMRASGSALALAAALAGSGIASARAADYRCPTANTAADVAGAQPKQRDWGSGLTIVPDGFGHMVVVESGTVAPGWPSEGGGFELAPQQRAIAGQGGGADGKRLASSSCG